MITANLPCILEKPQVEAKPEAEPEYKPDLYLEATTVRKILKRVSIYKSLPGTKIVSIAQDY